MEALVENEGGRDGSTAGLTQTSQAAQWLPSSEESSLAQTSLKQPEQWLQVTMGQNCKELQSRFGHTERNVFVQFQNPRHIYYVIYSRAIVFAEMLRLYMYIYIEAFWLEQLASNCSVMSLGAATRSDPYWVSVRFHSNRFIFQSDIYESVRENSE